MEASEAVSATIAHSVRNEDPSDSNLMPRSSADGPPPLSAHRAVAQPEGGPRSTSHPWKPVDN